MKRRLRSIIIEIGGLLWVVRMEIGLFCEVFMFINIVLISVGIVWGMWKILEKCGRMYNV